MSLRKFTGVDTTGFTIELDTVELPVKQIPSISDLEVLLILCVSDISR